jgi:hypothetical protein
MALLDPPTRSYRPSRRDFLRLGGLGGLGAAGLALAASAGGSMRSSSMLSRWPPSASPCWC